MELGDRGGEVDEPAEEEATRLNYFGGKREVAYQGQEFPLSARRFVLPLAEKLGKRGKLVCRKSQDALLGVYLYSKKGDGGGWAEHLVKG